jgi:hypothetical protein
MARYSKFKYGGAKYGSSGLTTLLWALEVDWDNDGVFTGAVETGRLQSISITRGREGLFSASGDGEAKLARPQVGECRMVLDNYDRRFTPWYTSSPLYPNVLPGREVKLWVRNGSGGTDYNIFRGKIDDIPPARLTDDTIQFICSDGWKLLTKQRSTVALRTNTRADVLMGDVLDDASWPSTWGRSLDVAADTIPYGWVNDQSCFDAIHDMAESEMGLAYVGADGKFYYKARHTLMLDTSALTLTQSEVGKEIEIGNPWEFVRNKVSVKAYPRALAALGEIWTLDETPSIAPGQSRTIWATFRDSNYTETIAQDVVSPVATTDYTMNTDSGGGGTDLTASFSVTATIFAGSAKLVVTNNGSVDGYITLLRIRGKPLELLNVAASISESTSSQAIYGKQQLTLELPFLQQSSVAVDLSDWLLSWLASPLPMVTVEIVNRPTIQFAYDLGTTLTFQSAYLGVDKRFRICKIRHESAGTMQAIRTLWTLEPVDQATDYWQLGTVGHSELGTHTRLAY